MLRCISSFNPHLDAITWPLQEPQVTGAEWGWAGRTTPGAPALTPDRSPKTNYVLGAGRGALETAPDTGIAPDASFQEKVPLS